MSLCQIGLYFVEVGVGAVGVEDFVAVHDCDEVFSVGEVDDVVGVAGQHYHGLDAVARDFVVEDLVGAFFTHLYQSMAFDNYELLPLGVVPVLSFGYAGLGNVDAHLSALGGMDEFGEQSAVVAIHVEVEHGFFFGQI